MTSSAASKFSLNKVKVDIPSTKSSHLDVPLQGKQIPKLDPDSVRFNSRPDLHLKASPADGTLAKLKSHPTVSMDVPKVKQISGDSATKAIGGIKPSDVDVPKVKDIHSSGNANFPKPTFKPSMEIPVNERGYTKSSLKLGREVHKEYKINDVDNIDRYKEYVLPSGKRVDFIDFENQIIYELKPNNPKQIKLGKKQLQGYIDEMKSIDGGDWKGVLDTY